MTELRCGPPYLGVSRWLTARWVADRMVALVALVIASPVMAALGLAIRHHDHGPALIGLRRCGLGGEQFVMWKLRTMRVGDSAARCDGAELTLYEDPRITPLGRRLRHLRLDELPQLWNVVRGDMALIGPRPETPKFVDSTDPAWKSVLGARPGIAGVSQIVLHDWEPTILDEGIERYVPTVLPVKLRIDQWYVRNASPRLDLAIASAIARRLIFRQWSTSLHLEAARATGETAFLPPKVDH